MSDDWRPPQNHPLTIEQAKVLLAGNLGDVYRAILRGACAPIFWYRVSDGRASVILHNGTLTIARTAKKRLLGITAAHVLR